MRLNLAVLPTFFGSCPPLCIEEHEAYPSTMSFTLFRIFHLWWISHNYNYRVCNIKNVLIHSFINIKCMFLTKHQGILCNECQRLSNCAVENKFRNCPQNIEFAPYGSRDDGPTIGKHRSKVWQSVWILILIKK